MGTLTMMAAVAAGGAIGAIMRYSVSLVIGAGVFGISGPLATLVVNIVGSALMGFLASSISVGLVLPEAWRGFLAVGMIGALTTFSSFALDAGQLWQTKGIIMAGAYVLASVVLSLAAFGMAFLAVRYSGVWQ
ncbi:fluoride efflux transporter CrcB [Candidatus Puniceispirillum sp.]|nr:fluoride efflux transporter CrcB [Candidatus Puniceispirillum sp.]